jgi:hypothetical protein
MPVVSRMGSKQFLKSVVLKFEVCELNAPQSVLLRAWAVAWPGFWANKKISAAKHHWSSSLSGMLDTSVYSFQNFIANSILLKWWVFWLLSWHLLTKNHVLSTGAGASTGTDKLQSQILPEQRRQHWRFLMCVLWRLCDISLTAHTIFLVPTD